MPISTSYPKGVPIEDADLFVGTKASNNRTVNYTAEGIANYLNINSKVAIGGQMSFQFVIVPNIPKTISFEGGGGNNTSFSAITKLIVSALDVSSTDITVFLNYLTNSDILLSQQNQPNYFGHYKIVSYTQIGITDFYELVLEYIGGNGAIAENVYYDIVSFVLSVDAPVITGWTIITTNQTLELNKEYLTDSATKLELTLPIDNQNKTIKVASKLGGWKLLVPIGWQVLIADEIIAQDLESTLDTDSIELLSLGNNKFSAIELKGNIIFNNL